MTARRTNVTTRKSPALTGGDDRPQPACAGRPEPFDVLHDLTSGPAFKAAQREARAMCSMCPIMAACLGANRKEPWAKAVPGRRPTDVACGTESGYTRHRRLGEETCYECKAEQAAAERKRYARRKKAAA